MKTSALKSYERVFKGLIRKPRGAKSGQSEAVENGQEALFEEEGQP